MRSVFPFLLLLLTVKCHAQNVKPLVGTHWGQNYPYNILAPAHDFNGLSVRPIAGCGAIAMAQVIKYHQSPSLSPDQKYTYDYGLMYHTANNHQTRDELIAVGKLISDCGVAAFTQYGDDWSSTNMSSILGALKRSFGYSNYMCLYKRKDFSTPRRDSLYREILYNELRQGRPVIYRGQKTDKKEGHIFIIDGCKKDKFHVNMGWTGNHDGYYDLNDLYGYSNEQYMIVGVMPNTQETGIRTLHVEQAGTLASLLSPEEKERTQHIALSGCVDSTDIALLRTMLREGLLCTIDLRDATIDALPDSAFYDCEQLSYAILPTGCLRIGERAFSHCHNLNRIVLPSQLAHIDKYAFSWCKNLIRIDLPSSLQTIHYGVFRGCNGIFNLTIPEGTWQIRNNAFADMKNLLTLCLPKSLRSSHASLVNNCPRLKDYTIHPDNPYFRIEGTELKKK